MKTLLISLLLLALTTGVTSAQFAIDPPERCVPAGVNAGFSIAPTHQLSPGDYHYFVGVSVNTFGGWLLPDALFHFSFNFRNSLIFQHTYGTLHPTAPTRFNIYPLQRPELKGLTLYVGGIVYNQVAGRISLTNVAKLYIY